jgi:predicted nucleic acid-binding Zn ribbon protein
MSEHGDRNEPVDRRSGSLGRAEGLGSILREALGQGPLLRGVSLGRLVRGWEGVVGPQLAAQTAPRALDGGVLVVAASTPAWAAQVRFLGAEVSRRANDALGRDTVRQVRVVIRPESPKRLGRNASGGPWGSEEPPRRGPPSDRI